MTGYGFKGFSSMSRTIDKGHKTQFNLLIQRIKEGGPALIPFEELSNTTRASFAALKSLQQGEWVYIA